MQGETAYWVSHNSTTDVQGQGKLQLSYMDSLLLESLRIR
jgi:hypothetical protein